MVLMNLARAGAREFVCVPEIQRKLCHYIIN